MSVDASWTVLLRSALDGAHADRFGVPPALIERARTSTLGRRMLARRLENESQPLFALASASGCEAALQHPIAFFSGERLRGAAFDLGALAFAPALRARVARDEVLLMRESIGAARLSFVLSADPWPQGVPEAVRHCAMTGLARAMADAETLADRVRHRGRIELYAYSSNLEPLLGERVKLAFAPLTAGERSDAWLPPAAVARYLDAANDGAPETHS